MAFLLSSARLASALRLMSHAERNLKRHEEAEETLVTAMRVFGGSHIRTCLESMYADTDDTMESGEMVPVVSLVLIFFTDVVRSLCTSAVSRYGARCDLLTSGLKHCCV